MKATVLPNMIAKALKDVLRLLAIATIATPVSAITQTPAPQAAPTTAEGSDCGRSLSAPVLARWTSLGGETSPLGCPVAVEAPTAASRTGTQGREADFKGGAILWHGSGGRAGQTFVVTGCVYRLFFQYGGPGGWLGFPTSDAINTPDGQRQSFEGGRIIFSRATDDCDAEPATDGAASSASTAESAQIATSPLDLFYDPARDDHMTIAAAATVARAVAAHYQRVRGEAFVLTDNPGHGAAPLKLFWNENQGDHVTTATADGERDALGAGYAFEASQGFVWTDPRPGGTPLKQFRHPESGHSLLVANPASEAEALGKGFVFVRIEGYAAAAP